MTRSQKKNLSLIILIPILLFLFNSALAGCCSFPLFSQAPCLTLHRIVSIGAGLDIAVDHVDSRTFPIINSVTDQFFIYHSRNNHQRAGFIDGFIGTEWTTYLSELLLQMGIGYHETSNFHIKGRVTQGINARLQRRFPYSYLIFARQILAEAKFLFNIPCLCYQPYHPYVLVGFGVSFNRAKDFHAHVPAFLPSKEFANNTEDSFSWTLGLGLDVDVKPWVRVGGGYRITDYGHVKFGKSRVDSVSVPESLAHSHFYTHEFLVQLTYIC